MTEMDRRHFLKLCTTVAAGFVGGTFTFQSAEPITKGVQKLSDKSVGNASARVVSETICEDTEDKNKCISEYVHSGRFGFVALIVAPLSEEFIIRAVPSLIVSKWEGAKDLGEVVLRGTGGLTMTRREIIAGVVTSVFFGGIHNITKEGLNMEFIPAPQFVGGLSLWYLQRKFGILANIIAHAFHNFLAIRSI